MRFIKPIVLIILLSLMIYFSYLLFLFVDLTSYKLWQSLLIIQIICCIETGFYVIPVFPHYNVSLAMPCRYSSTFRVIQFKLESFSVRCRWEIEPSSYPSGDDYKTHGFTNHVNQQHKLPIRNNLSLLIIENLGARG
jgi:hypothetical protein